MMSKTIPDWLEYPHYSYWYPRVDIRVQPLFQSKTGGIHRPDVAWTARNCVFVRRVTPVVEWADGVTTLGYGAALLPRTLQEEDDDDDDDANALQRRRGQIRWNRREFACVRNKIFGASRKHLFRFASSSSSFSSLKQQIELILLLFVNFWTSSQQSIWFVLFSFLFLSSSGFRYNHSRHRRLCNFTFVSWDFCYSDLRAKKQKSEEKKKRKSSTLVLHAKPPSSSEQEQNRTEEPLLVRASSCRKILRLLKQQIWVGLHVRGEKLFPYYSLEVCSGASWSSLSDYHVSRSYWTISFACLLHLCAQLRVVDSLPSCSWCQKVSCGTQLPIRASDRREERRGGRLVVSFHYFAVKTTLGFRQQDEFQSLREEENSRRASARE